MIRKFAIIPLLILVMSALSFAQTTVTGTIVDANSNPYANGTVSAYYLPSTGQGSPFTLNSTTNASGFFSIVLKSAGAYQFTVCAMPVNIGPLANSTPTQICAYSSPIQISGGSQDVSTQINAAAPVLGPKSTAIGNLPTAISQGQLPAASGPGNTYLAQSKGWIDVRDGFGGSGGVDCTGVADSTAILQLMINNAPDYSSFFFPQGCKVKVSGSTALTLDQRIGLQFLFAGRNGNGCSASNAQSAMIYYNQTYASGNRVWYINRSQSIEFRNMTIWANGGADYGIDIDQIGATPPITTRNDFYNVCILNNATRNPSWIGVALARNGASNTDNQHFYHLDVTCSSQSPTSSSSNGYGFSIVSSFNPKNTIVDDIRTTNCSIPVAEQNGGDFSMVNGLGSGYVDFFANGFNDLLMGYRSEGAANVVSLGPIGPHLIMHDDFAASGGTIIDGSVGCGITTIINNEQDSSSIKSVDCHGANGTIIALNNRNFNMLPTEAPSFVMSPTPAGPLSQTGSLTSTDTNWISLPLRVTFPSTTAWGSSGLIFDTLRSSTYDHFVLQSVIQAADSNIGLNINYTGSNTGYIGLGGTIPGLLVGPNSTVAPTVNSISPRGVQGITSWSYVIQAITATGHSDCSGTSTVPNGNAVLSGSNANVILGTPYAGAIYYNVYRTVAGGTPSTTGLIGKIIGYTGIGHNTGNDNFLTFNDNGLAGDGSTCPIGNTTGTLVARGRIQTNITGSSQCVQADTNGFLSGTGLTCGSGGGGLSGLVTFGFLYAANPTTAVSTTPGTNQGTYTSVRNNTVHGTAAAPTEAQVGDCALPGTITGATTTYTVLYTDILCNVSHDIAASQSATITIPTPATLDNPAPIFGYSNYSTHDDTLTPTTYAISAGNVAAGANITAKAGFSCKIQLDPTNASTWKADCHQMQTSASISFSGNTSVSTSAGAGVSSAVVGNPIVADGSGNVIPQVGTTTVGVGGVNGWGLPIWENDSVTNGTPVNNTLYVHQVRIAGLPQTIGHATFNVVTGGTSETMYVCVYNVSGSTLLWSAAGAVNTSATVVSSTAAQVTLQPGYYLFAYGQTGTASAVVTADGSIGTATWINIMNQNGVRVGTAANNASSGCPATTGVLSASTGVGAAMKFMLEP